MLSVSAYESGLLNEVIFIGDYPIEIKLSLMFLREAKLRVMVSYNIKDTVFI